MPIYYHLPEFAQSLEKGVLMGIDPGKKRIGVAFSDPQQNIAFSAFIANQLHETLPEFTKRSAIGVVMGLPRNTDGTIGASAKNAEKQASKLLELLGDVPILLWEEWYSSSAMEKMLIDEVDMSRAKRKKNLDKLAAAFILQGALDAIRNLQNQP